MRTGRYQRGITLSGLIMGCIVIGGAALLFMKLWPVYNEKFKVDQAMAKLGSSPEGFRLTKPEMVRIVMTQFDVSDVDTFNRERLTKLLQVGRKKNSPNKVVLLAYEIRAPLFGDLDVVLKYRYSVEFAPPKTD